MARKKVGERQPVRMSPNAMRVQAEIEARDHELAELPRKGWRAVDPNGTRAREILVFLANHGAATAEYVSTDMDLEPDQVLVYAKALERAGRVKIVARYIHPLSGKIVENSEH